MALSSNGHAHPASSHSAPLFLAIMPYLPSSHTRLFVEYFESFFCAFQAQRSCLWYHTNWHRPRSTLRRTLRVTSSFFPGTNHAFGMIPIGIKPSANQPPYHLLISSFIIIRHSSLTKFVTNNRSLILLMISNHFLFGYLPINILSFYRTDRSSF